MKTNKSNASGKNTPQTREKPILFSAPMVRAILEGRKTMTRRVIKGAPNDRPVLTSQIASWKNPPVQYWCLSKSGDMDDLSLGNIFNIGECPYGNPGDRLWVRETFHDWVPDSERLDEIKSGVESASDYVEYRADRPNVTVCDGGWTPSIFMPRWASRITLEITNIRVEQLQNISNQDIENEGACSRACVTHRLTFQQLWESINGPGSWDANPWVWVIEFSPIPSSVIKTIKEYL